MMLCLKKSCINFKMYHVNVNFKNNKEVAKS